ncbi:MAG: sugar phosphate isomerase/epimerase [Spirochaetales bacterium]|nr:sugar phosphate isomerase/epimerase [Spirochaetales bacterium]
MKYAVCNEMFGDMEFGRAMDMLAAQGFGGVEIAPFTLFGDFSPAAVRHGLFTARSALAASGLAFAGMHWLFVKPEGLRLLSPGAEQRRRAWDHLNLLLDISGELGGGELVFGSPQQRSSQGTPKSDALLWFTEGLRAAAEYAQKQNSRILLEPLPSAVTDVVNTHKEAAEIIAAAGNPGLAGMFDFHNTADETDPWDALLDRYWDMLHHIHINETDGAHPAGRGRADFGPAFSLLRRRVFGGWVSLEIFTTPGDPLRVLRETMEFLKYWEAVQ